MKNKTELRDFFSAEIEELKPALFNYESILSSETWMGFIERENDLPVTTDSIVDCTNDGLCVLFSNLRKHLNACEEMVSERVENPLFEMKVEEATELFGENSEEHLVSIIDSIAEDNAKQLLAELGAFDVKEEAKIEQPTMTDLTLLISFGDKLHATLEEFDVEQLAFARDNALETLDMMDVDDLGLDLISQLQNASGVFPLEEPSVESK